MAASTGKTASETPAFSYAQAAKGFSSPSSQQQTAEKQNKAAETTTEQSKSATTNGSTDIESSQSTPARTADRDTAASTTEGSVSGEKSELPSETNTSTASTTSTQPAPGKNVMSGATSPSIGAASTPALPKEDDTPLTPNGTPESTWDKQSQGSASAEKPKQAEDGSKEKPVENGWDKSASSPKELKAAPIPTVNIWQQRKEAQEAKNKAAAALKTASPNVASSKFTQQPVDLRLENQKSGTNKKKGAESSETPIEGLGIQMKGQRKPADSNKSKDDSTKKPGVRSNRAADSVNEMTESLPNVADTESWPTPQLAQGEESRKAQTKAEKSDKSEKDKQTTGRSHGKEKWMPVPYVPSAVFSTPLPAARRGGGRAPRGGREGGPRGAGNNVNQNAGLPASTVAVGGSKQVNPADRGRNAARAVPDTVADQRASSAGAMLSAESRKLPQATQADQPREFVKTSKGGNIASTASDATQHAHPNSGDTASRQRQDSRNFTKGTEGANLPQKVSDHIPRHMNFHGDSHGTIRYNSNHERRFESGSRSADVYNAPTFSPRDRDFSNQRSERDFGRDWDFGKERGDSRPERGRGGYRGRGGHSHYSGVHNSQYHSAPIGQHGFPPQKAFALGDRHRSNQQPSQNGTHGAGQRLTLRSPSLPSPAMYPPYAIQTDINGMYGYPQWQQGPMTAMAYQPQMEQFSLMSMISMQLEYYFSVDNLCKDLFLRKHMDSQGFVLLSVIASFKRIKSLTEDMDLLRYVCQQVRNIDFRRGQDGLDRLRPREKWEQWVLSMENRDPSAQNEGPSMSNTDALNDTTTPPSALDGHVPFSNGVSHDIPAPVAQPQYPSINGGTTEPRASQSMLSSTAPEFSPSFVPSADKGEKLNVGKPIDESSFPDSQIEKLVIVVRKPGVSSPAQSPFLIPTSRSFSSGSVDGSKAAGGPLSDENKRPFPFRATQVNADSFDFDRRQPNSATKSKASNSVNTQMPTFWIKDRDTPIESLPADLTHESYNVFRRQTLEKRSSASTASDTNLDMDVLYQFWSHFLVRNFNSKMYDEFRSLAFDDLNSRNSRSGLNSLIRFYDGVLSNNNPIPDRVAKDLVELVKSESGSKEKPTFQRLRSAWRNGAFNLKNRKKIDNIIDRQLKAELES